MGWHNDVLLDQVKPRLAQLRGPVTLSQYSHSGRFQIPFGRFVTRSPKWARSISLEKPLLLVTDAAPLKWTNQVPV